MSAEDIWDILEIVDGYIIIYRSGLGKILKSVIYLK